MANTKTQLDPEKLAAAAATCACFNFRKASRAVTQMFDEVLQPTGLRSTQLVMLIAIGLAKQANAKRLAHDLVLDRSTLTRNLRPLMREGLVKFTRGQDRRSKAIELTARGRRALSKALPVWEEAQNRFVAHIGPERWEGLKADLAAVLQG